MSHGRIRSRCWMAEGCVLTVDHRGLHVEVTDSQVEPGHPVASGPTQLSLPFEEEDSAPPRVWSKCDRARRGYAV